jgi:hypothetical protein
MTNDNPAFMSALTTEHIVLQSATGEDHPVREGASADAALTALRLRRSAFPQGTQQRLLPAHQA